MSRSDMHYQKSYLAIVVFVVFILALFAESRIMSILS